MSMQKWNSNNIRFLIGASVTGFGAIAWYNTMWYMVLYQAQTYTECGFKHYSGCGPCASSSSSSDSSHCHLAVDEPLHGPASSP